MKQLNTRKKHFSDMKEVLDKLVIEVEEDLEEDRTPDEIKFQSNRAARFAAKNEPKVAKKEEVHVPAAVETKAEEKPAAAKKSKKVEVEEEEEEEEEFFDKDEEEEESESEEDEESQEEDKKKKKKGKSSPGKTGEGDDDDDEDEDSDEEGGSDEGEDKDTEQMDAESEESEEEDEYIKNEREYSIQEQPDEKSVRTIKKIQVPEYLTMSKVLFANFVADDCHYTLKKLNSIVDLIHENLRVLILNLPKNATYLDTYYARLLC